MKCARVRRELSAYIDGEVSVRVRRMIENHLAQCPECDRHRQELVQVVESVRRLATIEPATEFCADAIRRIRTATKVPASAAVGFRRWEIAIVTCLVLGACVIGWMAVSQFRSRQTPPDMPLSPELTMVANLLSDSDSVPIEEMIRTLSDTEKDELKAALLNDAKGGYESNDE